MPHCLYSKSLISWCRVRSTFWYVWNHQVYQQPDLSEEQILLYACLAEFQVKNRYYVTPSFPKDHGVSCAESSMLRPNPSNLKDLPDVLARSAPISISLAWGGTLSLINVAPASAS